MAGFERDAGRAVRRRPRPRSVLDVGCGEGVLTAPSGRNAWAPGAVVGIDLEDPKLRGRVGDPRQRANLEFRADARRAAAVRRRRVRPGRRDRGARARPRPRAARSPRWPGWPAAHLLVSVPREPLWRALNVARGAYLRELGNTPGHVNHWSKRGVRPRCSAGTARWSRRARRSRGRCCWCAVG